MSHLLAVQGDGNVRGGGVLLLGKADERTVVGTQGGVLGGAGLGGCLTPTGVGTEVENGKQKLTINGKEYLLEMPLHADVSLIKATKADTAGNLYFHLNSRATNSTMAFAGDFVIAEVEEVVEVGELGPEEIHVPAPIVDMVYVRTGEKRPLCPMWQRAKAKAEAKAREKAEGGNK